MWWWILAVDEKGKPDLDGPHATEAIAQRIIDDRYEVEAQAIGLPTRSQAAATRLLKHKRLITEGHQEGKRRFSHSKFGGSGGSKDERDLDRQQEHKALLKTRRAAHIVHERSLED